VANFDGISMLLNISLQQLEKCIDDALRKNDFKPLLALLQIDICEDVKIKCSKQFLRKLDDLICRVNTHFYLIAPKIVTYDFTF
jgi:hypothetical protein